MTQEDKELFLKDICCRLPYHTLIKYKDAFYNVVGIAHGRLILCKPFMSNTLEDYPRLKEIKPYLFPLSSMTEEQLFEVQEILGKNEIKIEDCFLRIVDSDRNTISYLEILALLNWFYKNHFDCNGLIPKGLAIDATGLNIY